MQTLGDDSRYDMARWFEAESAVELGDACDRMMRQFGRSYGLKFEADCDWNGDRGGMSIWTEARGENIAIYATTCVPYSDDDMSGGAPLQGPFTYRVVLYWNQAAVTMREERTIRAAIAEAFACVLVPLPKQCFG